MRYSSLYTSRLPTELYPRTYTASDREKGKKIEFSLLFLLFFSSPLLSRGSSKVECKAHIASPLDSPSVLFLVSCWVSYLHQIRVRVQLFIPMKLDALLYTTGPASFLLPSFPFFGWGCLSRALWSQHGRSLSWRVIQQPATSCEKKKKENREVP